MKKSRLLTTTLLISSAITLTLPHSSFSAETCSFLEPVGGKAGETIIKKTVTAPSVPVGVARLKRDNWNTDFAVKSNIKAKRYLATLNPLSDGTYSVKVYLKYNNGTADEIYHNKPKLSSDKPLVISGKPRANEQPYQVNVFVGDAESVGKSYQISVKACQ
ncbi:hypothetical protein [Gloeothece verrucosa]|uniref:Uncharacterized protein n=1 Tax=Gloeothece verrucosa (strain PCC 7822) TaxID=497965 RepID=E0UIX1_GLOV7|nr:hypothetical protein [Gloeothece verrucosa]ADN14551.1 conserved hypothetical protein [Gloeothece verrucosa PCC 7822]